MASLLLALATAAAVAASGASSPESTDAQGHAAHYGPLHLVSADHFVTCVSALKPAAQKMAGKYKAGDDDIEVELVALTAAAMSLTDAAYATGLTAPDAATLLTAAQTRLKDMAPKDVAQLVEDCRTEGETMLSAQDATSSEKTFAAAAARVQQLRTE
jgi:hypothetical protein